MNIKRLKYIFIVAWLSSVSASFLLIYSNATHEQERVALESARNFFDYIIMTRLWNARHGSVYVPVTEDTQPNPYLDEYLRDIKVNDELTVTKVNPAFMTRQLSEIATRQNGVQFRISSLRPIHPQNMATGREADYLKIFETGIEEKGEFIRQGNETSYFYMAPLIVKESCLNCHKEQGHLDKEYKVGDVRGGISITSPFIMKIPILSLLLGHAILGLIGIFGIAITASKLNRAYETIKTHALFDDLTGIPNRRNFTENIVMEYKRCQRNQQALSIILCDIDSFKQFNDTYGHNSGDQCLKKVAQTIKKSLLRPGDFCARYGGEEFIVLLPNTPLEGAAQIAETIRANIEQLKIPNKNSTANEFVTLSLGITTCNDTSTEFYEEIVKQADNALYRAKKLGKNQLQCFNPA